MAFLVGGIGLGAACASKAGGEAASDAAPPDAFRATGCATAPTHPVAPGGYYVDGNTVCTAAGRAHLFHGVDRPSLEWSSVGVNLSLADFQLMASWNANVVRVALNQDFWIAASPLFDPSYASLVDTAVTWAEAEGLDVILDLHWSDAGVLGSCLASCQQKMADANSITFWSEVATRYQNDGRVLFELYNEPHNVSWSVWQSGGDTGDGRTPEEQFDYNLFDMVRRFRDGYAGKFSLETHRGHGPENVKASHECMEKMIQLINS